MTSLLKICGGILGFFLLVSCSSQETPIRPPVISAPVQPAPQVTDAPELAGVREAVRVVRESLAQERARTAAASRDADVARMQGEELANRLRGAESRGEATLGELAAFREQAESLDEMLQNARAEWQRRARKDEENREQLEKLNGEVADLSDQVIASESEKGELRVRLADANSTIRDLSAESQVLFGEQVELAKRLEASQALAAERAKRQRFWVNLFVLLVILTVLFLGVWIWSKVGSPLRII